MKPAAEHTFSYVSSGLESSTPLAALSAAALTSWIVTIIIFGWFCAWVGCAARSQDLKSTPEPSEVEFLQMRYELVESLIQNQSYETATPLLKDLISRFPKEARLHLFLGIILREKGALEAAEEEFKLSLNMKPNQSEVLTAMGVLMMKRHRLKEAEKYHRRAIQLSPVDARLFNDLGFCLLAQRRLSEAKKVLLQSIHLEPNYRRAYNNLGFVLGLLGDGQGAWKAFQQAGSRAMAFTNMGFLAEMQKKKEEAISFYKQALNEQRNYKPAIQNLQALDPGNWNAAGEWDMMEEENTNPDQGSSEEKPSPSVP